MHLNLLVLLIITIVCCEGHVKVTTFHKAPEFADQICPHDQVDFQTVTENVVSCVRKCSEKPGCRGLVYLPSNKTCFGINADYPFGVNIQLPGAVFYQSNNLQTTPTSAALTTTVPPPKTKTSTTTETITVSTITPAATTMEPGTPMVVWLPDSQFTASSYYGINYTPWNARLNNTIIAPWEPAVTDTNQWLQIDFMRDITATHVITKGRHSDTFLMWVTSYKFLTSTDCTNFVVVKDDFGNDQVFPGNTDQYTAVQHSLIPQVVCRCFRVNPQTWQGSFIALRLEVLGHLM